MSRVDIEPKMAAALKRLKKLQGRIEDPAPILQEVGEMLRKTTVSRFYSKTSPTGRKWKRTKRRRHALRDGRVQRGSTLVLTGALRDSIEAGSRGGKLFVGTDVWYGRLHQEGGRINAFYRRVRRARRGFRLSVRSIVTSAGRQRKIRSIIRGLLMPGGKGKARQVRLPARKFLGASKSDRKRTTQILIDKLNEAVT